jgi:hypothetical protein
MRRRNVNDEQVREVLADPQLVRPADRGNWYERTLLDGQYLKVVAIKGEVRDNEFVVYTVAWRDDNEA